MFLPLAMELLLVKLLAERFPELVIEPEFVKASVAEIDLSALLTKLVLSVMLMIPCEMELLLVTVPWKSACPEPEIVFSLEPLVISRRASLVIEPEISEILV